VPSNVKSAIGDSIKASNSPSAAAGDKTGGFHEEGGIWITTTSGSTVPVPAVPGPANPGVVGGAHMDVTNSANPGLKDNIASVGGEWHVHPSGSITQDGKIISFAQPPSAKDIHEAVGPISIVVGAGDKKVYFYNSSGVIGSPMKLKDFMGQ
jgi:hypothetical protein